MLKCTLGGSEWIGSFQSQTLNESCQYWTGPRRDSRHSLKNAAQDIHKALPHLPHANLNFLYPLDWAEDFHERNDLPDLVRPALWDPFSTSLRILSYQLRTMRLRVVADKTLFWSIDNNYDCTWPNTESMNIMFNNFHPSGSWYFNSHF